jgi:hypothetical protein
VILTRDRFIKLSERPRITRFKQPQREDASILQSCGDRSKVEAILREHGGSVLISTAAIAACEYSFAPVPDAAVIKDPVRNNFPVTSTSPIARKPHLAPGVFTGG